MKRNEILKKRFNEVNSELSNYVEKIDITVYSEKPIILHIKYVQYLLNYLKAVQNRMTLSEYVQTEWGYSETQSNDYVNSLRDCDKREFEIFKRNVERELKSAD